MNETVDITGDDSFTHLMLADQLDTVVDHLADQVRLQPTEHARDSLVSYLYAHSQAARALREMVAGERGDSEEHMREAALLLERVNAADFVIV
ncbi:hypothetical protein ACFWN2_07515 [Lentzea sp. NPDC058436]|uniref:hypothetical protein n=1 Tax=Lentzea sp. NPDC058436 TaxID=3346499 RepID=UPI0036523D98